MPIDGIPEIQITFLEKKPGQEFLREESGAVLYCHRASVHPMRPAVCLLAMVTYNPNRAKPGQRKFYPICQDCRKDIEYRIENSLPVVPRPDTAEI